MQQTKEIMWKYSKEIMSIILIIILLVLLVWIIRQIRMEGFMGSSSSDTENSEVAIITDSPEFIKTTIPAIQAFVDSATPDFRALRDTIAGLDKETADCTVYSTYRYPTHVKNRCSMSRMYINAVSGVLDTALTDGVGTPNDKSAVVTLSKSFINNQISYNSVKQDSYANMVEKFNTFDRELGLYLPTVPSIYNYIVPDYVSKSGLASPRSYKCVSFDKSEQTILGYLRRRILGTAAKVKTIADGVEVNLCKSKGWQTGKATFKGCTGCLGCCEPTMDELPAAAPITGANTITADGTVAATGTVGVAGEAKCPQPKLREYRLNRKPAKFRKVQAPTPAFMECFEDADGSVEEDMMDMVSSKPLNLREAARTQKGAKMYGLTENPWIQ